MMLNFGLGIRTDFQYCQLASTLSMFDVQDHSESREKSCLHYNHVLTGASSVYSDVEQSPILPICADHSANPDSSVTMHGC